MPVKPAYSSGDEPGTAPLNKKMIRQRTLKNCIRAAGAGLHTGRKVTLALRPAPLDNGIVVRRVDLDPPVCIPAHPDNVSYTTLSTTLASDGASICTVEHLLSAAEAPVSFMQPAEAA
jgi:UDP-3-O-[3-hydroxymyristoyl] N-acetylglucosamine deacetylase